MKDRTLILKLGGGQCDQWSACYSDRPDEKAYGTTMDIAIERLRQRRQLLADGVTMGARKSADK